MQTVRFHDYQITFFSPLGYTHSAPHRKQSKALPSHCNQQKFRISESSSLWRPVCRRDAVSPIPSPVLGMWWKDLARTITAHALIQDERATRHTWTSLAHSTNKNLLAWTGGGSCPGVRAHLSVRLWFCYLKQCPFSQFFVVSGSTLQQDLPCPLSSGTNLRRNSEHVHLHGSVTFKTPFFMAKFRDSAYWR